MSPPRHYWVGVILAAVIATGVGIRLFRPEQDEDEGEERTRDEEVEVVMERPSILPFPPPDPPPLVREDLSAAHLQGYGDPDRAPQQDLVLVNDVIEVFGYTVKVPDALPTAGNREIVAALLGHNAYGIRFLDPGFGFLNEEGEILDRWRTPLYFHFVEAREVGIRSAGPDRKMWTEDDLREGEFAEETR